MNVLALVPALHNTSPAQRFRLEQWARHLEPAGFRFTFVPFEDEALHNLIYRRGGTVRKAALMMRAFARRLALVTVARHFDLVYIVREAALVGPALIEHLIARQRVPIVFDFDDAIWVPYVSPANRYWSYLKCPGKTADICRVSAHVIVGNSYLAEYARRYNANVTVVPTTIDTEAYTVRVRNGGNGAHPVALGWTGSYSTVQHLDAMRCSLAALRRRHDFRLNVIGVSRYSVDGVETTAREWRAASEVQDLRSFDIGIMPLPNNGWNRGKCGLKLLQCMALGLPVVGSPLGVNTEIVSDGVDGFLAVTGEEWVEKLSRLIESPALRRDIGSAGRRTVEERYSSRAWVPTVKRVLESAARTGG